MKNLMKQPQAGQPLSQRQVLAGKYHTARMNLLLVVGFTVINLVLLLANSYTYFLFSASVPYYLTDLGMYLCGKYPAEFYGADYAELAFLEPTFLIAMVVISFLIVALYFVCWLMSKKHGAGWLIAALVLFAVDTVGMFLWFGISVDMIMDILFHAWVIYYLIMGIVVYYKFKKLPEEEEVPVTAFEEEPALAEGEESDVSQESDEAGE